MARAESNKLYRTFVKGLISEAGYLTYPQDASSDELNTVLSRKGNRTRRLGIDYETGYVARNHFPTGTEACSEYVWKSVGNDVKKTFLCVQTGSILFFYNLVDGMAVSNDRLTAGINLDTYRRPGATFTDLYRVNCTMVSGKGYLFVAHEAMDPIIVEYNKDTNDFTVFLATIQIRDFDGVPDGLKNDEEPGTMSPQHQYNLQNQGWVSYSQDPINQYFTATGRYPGNNKQWWVARAAVDDSTTGVTAGQFLPDTLEKLFSGSSRAPQGHYIINAFRPSRDLASGISDPSLYVYDLNVRPKAVSFYSGRVWWAANSTVYYSQIVSDKYKAAQCYQEADPTAEDISDLIASDGGVIQIPEADNIIAMTPQANGLVVFSNNGVWFVSGGSSQGFSARDIEVSKISPIGTYSPKSIVSLDQGLYYWSQIGIQAMQQAVGQFGPISGKFGNTNIAEQTIQTYYNNISTVAKQSAKAVFDERNNVIQWLFNTGDSDLTALYRYNGLLNYDITLQAFYPWEVATPTNGPQIAGVFQNIGDATTFNKSVRATNLTYLTAISSTANMTFSQFKDNSFADWVTSNGDGYAYDSYIETGYEILEDAMRRKQTVYVVTHCRRTEDDFGGAVSSCFMQVKWDWAATVFSNKWTTNVQIYRPKVYPPGTTADTGAGFPVIVSKNKVRGSGKSIQFRFGTNERGRNFDFLGWEAAYVGNTKP